MMILAKWYRQLDYLPMDICRVQVNSCSSGLIVACDKNINSLDILVFLAAVGIDCLVISLILSIALQSNEYVTPLTDSYSPFCFFLSHMPSLQLFFVRCIKFEKPSGYTIIELLF